MMPICEEYDEVIIGAGLSGLMYGLTSVNSHRKILITESHHKVGGYATEFMRNKRKYVFDCSQHKVTGIAPNGNLKDALMRVGVWDQFDFKFFENFTNIIYKDELISLPSGSEQIKSFLLDKFPNETKGILELFHDIGTYGYQAYMFARMQLGEYTLNKDLLSGSRRLSNITAGAYFTQLFKHSDLVDILSATAIYLGVLADEANAFYFLHFLYLSFNTGTGHLAAGTGQNISNILANEFKIRGGHILVNNPAIKINTDPSLGHICSVVTRKKTIDTSRVVATCSPHSIVEMFDRDAFPKQFQEHLNKLEFGWGHFCVYIACSVPPEKLGFSQPDYLLIGDEDSNLTKGNEHYQKFTLSITNYHKTNPDGGNILQLIVLDNAGVWFSLEEEAYKKRKQDVQQLLLQRAYRTFPDLKEHIDYAESSTPRTNYRYTRSPEGSAFGYKALPGISTRFLLTSPFKGLKFVGCWSEGAGYEAAMCLGFTQAMLERKRIEMLQNSFI